MLVGLPEENHSIEFLVDITCLVQIWALLNTTQKLQVELVIYLP